MTTASASAPGSATVRRISGSRREPRSSAISSSTTRSSRAAASTRGVGRASVSISTSAWSAPRSLVWRASDARPATRPARWRPAARGQRHRCWAPGRRRPRSGTSSLTSRTRPSDATAASTARRMASVSRARVMSVPGSTTDGQWQHGQEERRRDRRRAVGSGSTESVMAVRVASENLIATDSSHVMRHSTFGGSFSAK